MRLTQRTTILVTVAFGFLLLVIIALANIGVLHESLGFAKKIPLSDAVGHFLLMGAMALLVNLSLRARRFRLGPVGIMLGSVIVAAVVTAEEFSQLFLQHRSFSWIDLAADYMGIFILGRLALLLTSSKASEDEEDDADANESAEEDLSS